MSLNEFKITVSNKTLKLQIQFTHHQQYTDTRIICIIFSVKLYYIVTYLIYYIVSITMISDKYFNT